ncbi:hypothetical protein [Nafulsella turpanensis]|uniref:hypothetical protein n=1 Tax=Nafulsella turpanensis TaxID=1265690 RepID=UPI000347B03C|nr:hypothetical protein [Nafulsella turpanensis]
MKKLNAYFLLMLMMGPGFFTACDDEGTEPAFAAPEIEAVNPAVEQQPGGVANIDLSVNAEAGIKSIEVSGDAEGNVDFVADDNTQVVSYDFNLPADAAEGDAYELVFTVTDNQERTASANVTVTATATPVNTIVVESSEEGVGNTTWTSNNIYVLSGLVFVNEGQTLTIEPGTIIKGTAGTGSGASALVVARGGKIMAEGTAEEPIIFTALEDEIQPGEVKSTLPLTARGLWGGLMILGNASITTQAGEAGIEGIPVEETRGIYGGTNDADNSGVLRYVSIRHGGTEIGAGNEINGLTLGGVGSGTTVEHVEVISNKDDGFEWFGGTVNTKYLLSAYNGDEGMDYDQGWRGKNQFWFVYQDTEGDKGGEHDGGSSDCETCEPYSMPVIANATYVGGGANTLLVFQDNGAGTYVNSIFANYSEGIQVEDLESGEDSYNRFVMGELAIRNNIFHNVAGNDATKYIVLSTGANAGTDLSAEAGFADNITLDPEFNSLFLPAADVSGAGVVEGDFFTTVDFIGAFDPAAETPWHAGWTEWSQHVQ